MFETDYNEIAEALSVAVKRLQNFRDNPSLFPEVNQAELATVLALAEDAEGKLTNIRA